MPESIEAFVKKLQADGVKVGRDAAEKIRAEAQQQAHQLIVGAEEQARSIIAAADSQAEQRRSRTETELRLAARDTMLRLQGSIDRVLRTFLVAAVREPLLDATFVRQLLHEVVMQYVQADIGQHAAIDINVPEKMRAQLLDWVVHTLHKELESTGTRVTFQGQLAADGFEYRVTDGTVEVTVESVAQVLEGLAGPELRRLIKDAVNA